MEATLSAVAGGLGVIVLGLVSMVWRRNGNGATIQVENGYKIDALGTAIALQHETLKEILQVQRETKDAIISNGRR